MIKKNVRKFRVEDKIESDHTPLSVMLSTIEENRRKGKGSEDKNQMKKEKLFFPGM